MIKQNRLERPTFRTNQLVTCDYYPGDILRVLGHEHGLHGDIRYTVRSTIHVSNPVISGLRPKDLNHFAR
jgi:hypothetical protein